MAHWSTILCPAHKRLCPKRKGLTSKSSPHSSWQETTAAHAASSEPAVGIAGSFHRMTQLPKSTQGYACQGWQKKKKPLVSVVNWTDMAEASVCQNCLKRGKDLVTEGCGVSEPGLPFWQLRVIMLVGLPKSPAKRSDCQAGGEGRPPSSLCWHCNLAQHPRPFPGQSHSGSRQWTDLQGCPSSSWEM